MAQMMGQLVSLLVQFGVGKLALTGRQRLLARRQRLLARRQRLLAGCQRVLANSGNGLRRAGNLRCQQLGKGYMQRIAGGGIVPGMQKLRPFVRVQQVELGERVVGRGDNGGEQVGKVAGHALDGGLVEQIGVVGEGGENAGICLHHVQR